MTQTMAVQPKCDRRRKSLVFPITHADKCRQNYNLIVVHQMFSFFIMWNAGFPHAVWVDLPAVCSIQPCFIFRFIKFYWTTQEQIFLWILPCHLPQQPPEFFLSLFLFDVQHWNSSSGNCLCSRLSCSIGHPNHPSAAPANTQWNVHPSNIQ